MRLPGACWKNDVTSLSLSRKEGAVANTRGQVLHIMQDGLVNYFLLFLRYAVFNVLQ